MKAGGKMIRQHSPNVFCFFCAMLFFLFLVVNVEAWSCPRGSNQGCGANGCGSNERRECECVDCRPGGCGQWSCSCVGDSLCGPRCTKDCNGKTCGDDGCGGSCGTCSTGVCNGTSCCANVAPSKPILSSPENSTQVRVGIATTLSWGAVSSWGNACTGANNRYQVCISSNQVACDLVNYASAGTAITYGWTPSTADAYVTWAVRANNGALTNESVARSVCVEGFNESNSSYVSAWSACSPTTHQRTRTCTETCGTDDCTAFVSANDMVQDCTGEIRGTIFDATNLSSCPSFDPTTGYLIGVDTTLTANNRSFVMADQNNTSPHPWSLITPAETNSAGNYSVRVYSPATYTYDFTDLKDMYVVSSGPKLTCTSTNAVVAGSPTNCGTQPCTIVNNMSFGFDRYWSGWWQVEGAGVHGEGGIKSSIPSGLLSEQSLILGDSTAANRRGVASYGALTVDMLGINQNAKVSTNLWQVLSKYEGVIYDYGYFNQQFKKYATTTWDGTGAVSYDDNGAGYQIFKVAGPVTNFSYNPTGTQKVMFLIDGDVTINSNIVVPDGAFMVVLSSGNISFGTTVTRADGWYLGGNITISCADADNDSACDRTDSQFLGNGSFVSWKGTTLSRDMGGPGNIAAPAEKFTYRIDLYENAPEPMKILTKRYMPYVP